MVSYIYSYISRLIVRIEIVKSDEDYLENITEQLSTIGTILFFFLPFYVSQNYTRYYKMHGMTVTIINCIETCAVMAQAGLSQVVARRIIRYINASHLAFYTALSDNYTKENFFEPVVERFSLLNEDEINLIYEKVAVDNFGATICNEIISWVLKDCKNHDADYKIQHNAILLRNNFNELFLEKGRPIPFFYIHFLNTMVAIYLPAYSLIHSLNTGEHASWDVEFSSFLVLFVKAIYVLGILDLGRKLADPYGDDVVDINIVSYVITCIENCFKILCADAVVRDPDHSVELKLKQSLKSSGSISHVFKISDDL